ncbi:MAG: aldo/keto reductase [Candidatus Saliniplasma sp.]
MIEFKYNKFKGKEISELGMGCYALSEAYGPVESKAYKKVLEHAAQRGISFFDTADTYGPKAERVLGEVVSPIREEVVLQTKVGIKEGNQPNLSYDAVMSACEDSLERLGTSYIDYYLVHFADPETSVEETVGALNDLKTDGKIDGYGVSHIGLDEIRKYSKAGKLSIALMEFNAVSRKAKEELLPFCIKKDIGAVAFSVTGRGILTGKYRKDSPPEKAGMKSIDPLFKHAKFQSALRIVDKLKEIGKKYDKTPVQTAIRWVLSQPGIICALTGPSSKEHLDENLGGSGWEFYEEDLEELDEYLEMEEKWLDQKEPQVIRSLLTSPLNQDLQKVYSDMIYVIETSIQHSLTDENEVMPTFQKLWGMRSSEGGITKEKLQTIQEELRDLLY